MKKIYYILSALFLCVVATSAQEAGKTVVIKTNVGTMKAMPFCSTTFTAVPIRR